MSKIHPLYTNMGTTIFETVSRLADECKAINLGQGLPEEQGPDAILKKAADDLLTGYNQYPPMIGLPVLREAIAAHELRHWGLKRDPNTDIVVTSGATEALAAATLAFIDQGDEVIIFEPFYDAYMPLIERAGGVPVPVRLAPPDWELTATKLKQALSPRTKAILINDPLNPAGKVFSREEMELVADIAQTADLLVISDAVYEHLVFDNQQLVPISTIPGLNERTVKIGSAGKIFSLTGWKVGWITGPQALVSATAKAHQFLTFTTPPNLQSAVAYGLNELESWYLNLTHDLQQNRDQLADGLRSAGFNVIPSGGTYFSSVSLIGTKWENRDTEFCEWSAREIGVAAVPNSAFYMGDPDKNSARFCFAKKPQTLDEACKRLRDASGG